MAQTPCGPQRPCAAGEQFSSQDLANSVLKSAGVSLKNAVLSGFHNSKTIDKSSAKHGHEVFSESSIFFWVPPPWKR